jgi:hypothetical protein
MKQHCLHHNKKVIHAVRFLVISFDLVTIVDNQFYVKINANANLVDGFKHIPILLNLEKFAGGGTFDNMTNVIFNSLLVYGGFIVQEISSKLICFCSNGVDVFISVMV